MSPHTFWCQIQALLVQLNRGKVYIRKRKTFMPIYEYKCVDCGSLTSVFTKSISSVVEAVCGVCKGTDMSRLVSSFSMGKTTQSVHENSSYGSANSAEYYSDPRNIGRHVEEGFKKYGVDMPQGVRDSIESARSGELPKGLKE